MLIFNPILKNKRKKCTIFLLILSQHLTALKEMHFFKSCVIQEYRINLWIFRKNSRNKHTMTCFGLVKWVEVYHWSFKQENQYNHCYFFLCFWMTYMKVELGGRYVVARWYTGIVSCRKYCGHVVKFSNFTKYDK